MAIIEKLLQPGFIGALLTRKNGINDNLLFKLRSRYWHLIDNPVDKGVGTPLIINENIVPVVVERPPAFLPAVSSAPATPPKPGQVCEGVISPTHLKVSGKLAEEMLAPLVRELKRGRR